MARRGATRVRRLDGAMLREVLHAGIVVPDLDRAVVEWERLFGLRVGDRWESAIGVRVAFFDTPGGRIELVQYTGPIVERFGPVLAGRDGVHHLCFRVDDLDASLQVLGTRGLRVVPGFPVEGAHGRIAFLEPEPSTGLIVELCEVGRGHRDHATSGSPREPERSPRAVARGGAVGRRARGSPRSNQTLT